MNSRGQELKGSPFDEEHFDGKDAGSRSEWKNSKRDPLGFADRDTEKWEET